MEQDQDKLLKEWLNNFNTRAFIEYKNIKYKINPKELKTIYSKGNYWHHKTDPSSWLSVALVSLAKRKYSHKLPRHIVISLCAQLLNITSEKLESSLDWNANYMAFHDGGTPEENHVWQKE